MNNNPEKINSGPEHEHNPGALEQTGTQQREKLRKDRLEKDNEREQKPSGETIDDARHEALEMATSAELEKKAKLDALPPHAEQRNDGPIRQGELEAGFHATMKEVQEQMPAPSRAFSRVIHNKTVEKVSDVAATTVARPNAILSGAIFAFVLTLGIYLVAKNLGYPLSGFETIGAFILGWVIGIVYDFLKVMITGRK